MSTSTSTNNANRLFTSVRDDYTAEMLSVQDFIEKTYGKIVNMKPMFFRGEETDTITLGLQEIAYIQKGIIYPKGNTNRTLATFDQDNGVVISLDLALNTLPVDIQQMYFQSFNGLSNLRYYAFAGWIFEYEM